MKKDIIKRNELLKKIIKNDSVEVLTDEELDELYSYSDMENEDDGIIDITYNIDGLFVELYGEEVKEFEDEITCRITRDSNVRYFDNDFNQDVFKSYVRDAILGRLEK